MHGLRAAGEHTRPHGNGRACRRAPSDSQDGMAALNYQAMRVRSSQEHRPAPQIVVVSSYYNSMSLSRFPFILVRTSYLSCTAPCHRGVLTLHLENGPAGSIHCVNNGLCRQPYAAPASTRHLGIKSQSPCNEATHHRQVNHPKSIDTSPAQASLPVHGGHIRSIELKNADPR